MNEEHFEVNGRRATIASMILKPGDLVAVRQSSHALALIQVMAGALVSRRAPEWLSRDDRALSGRVISVPTRAEIETPVKEQLIVEFYSR